MSDVISSLEAQLAKLAAKIEKHEKVLEASRSEQADITTAIRVLRNLTGSGDDNQSSAIATPAVAKRQENILGLLQEGRANGSTPAHLLANYSLLYEDIPADTFRTTLWRMKGKRFKLPNGDWAVQGEDSVYWKEKFEAPGGEPGASNAYGRVAELEVPARSEQRPNASGENVGSSPTPPSPVQVNPWEDDLDDDIPF